MADPGFPSGKLYGNGKKIVLRGSRDILYNSIAQTFSDQMGYSKLFMLIGKLWTNSLDTIKHPTGRAFTPDCLSEIFLVMPRTENSN